MARRLERMVRRHLHWKRKVGGATIETGAPENRIDADGVLTPRVHGLRPRYLDPWSPPERTLTPDVFRVVKRRHAQVAPCRLTNLELSRAPHQASRAKRATGQVARRLERMVSRHACSELDVARDCGNLPALRERRSMLHLKIMVDRVEIHIAANRERHCVELENLLDNLIVLFDLLT